jgi:signal transduction histidine kinase
MVYSLKRRYMLDGYIKRLALIGLTLWLLGPDAAVSGDPVSPQAQIEAVLAEGQRFPISDHLVLPPRTTTITLQYAAVNAHDPQNVRFRYKLSSVDTNWQDGGAYPQAIYANLTPGDYVFEVIAADSGGVWSRQPAELSFRIKRTFFQRRCFQVLAIVAGILCVIALVILQYRRMLATLRDRLEVRHAERERIARELHDTLLQGIQGLILCFQAVAERIPSGEPLRAQIDHALDRADNVLVEGRDRVRDLRVSDRATKDLVVAFGALGESFAQQWPTRFKVTSVGDQREIESVVREEVYLIGREAVLNAFQHADAGSIELELAFEVKQFRLCVRDNGVGIDPEILGAGRRPGHWGLVGMRERANCIGGTLKIWARAKTGTEIELVVPATIAYAQARRSRGSWLKRLLIFGR